MQLNWLIFSKFVGLNSADFAMQSAEKGKQVRK